MKTRLETLLYERLAKLQAWRDDHREHERFRAACDIAVEYLKEIIHVAASRSEEPQEGLDLAPIQKALTTTARGFQYRHAIKGGAYRTAKDDLAAAVEEIENLRREIGLTRERLDELDQPAKRLYDFVPEMVDELHRELFALRSLSRTTPEGWQPIETAPRHERCFFWVIPKAADECPTNTSGHPITLEGRGEPHRMEGQWGWWGSLWKPLYWMPLPALPVDGTREHE